MIGRLRSRLRALAGAPPASADPSQEAPLEALHHFDEPALPLQPHGLAVPPRRLREAAGTGDLAMFLGLGDTWAHLASDFLPERPMVLDLGCGCGKMARFLALNPHLRYLGVDIHEPAILWCRRAFARYADRFRFEHLDAFSPAYNETARLNATEVVLPAKDASIDLAICGSLFTHLFEAEARHYLSELDRVLKPGAGALVSLHVEPKGGQPYSGDAWRIDVDEAYFLGMARAAGLEAAERLGVVYGQTTHLLRRA